MIPDHQTRPVARAFSPPIRRSALLSADTIVGGLPSDRLTISGPLGEVSLAQPAAQTEEPAGSAGA